MTLVDRLRSVSLYVRATAKLVPHLSELHGRAHSSGAVLLERNADRWPDRPALLYENERYTFAQVNRESNRWARFFLMRGVAHGDVVALLMDNRPEYVFALLGLGKIRGVAACLNTNLSGRALGHAVNIAAPRLVVTGSEHAVVLAQVAASLGRHGHHPRIYVHDDVRSDATSDGEVFNAELEGLDGTNLGHLSPTADEPMAYLYTSGTTGLPKAAVVTNLRFLLTSYGFGKVMHDATLEDVIYVALPLYHGTAQWAGLGACLATGATLALRRKFSASQFWSDAVRFRATRMIYIGELCRYLLHQPVSPDERQHRVRVAVGNGLRPDIWGAFQMRFGVPLIREFYGATESNAPLANLEGRPGMLGRIGFGQALVACDPETGALKRDALGLGSRIERAGETGLFIGRISGLAKFDGYVDARATSSKILRDVFTRGDAWFDTGDLLTLHEDGWLSFADRIGDTFRWKGENVSTNEVAELLHALPTVLEANVYGVLVPGADGRGGMASLRVTDDFDLTAFGRHVEEHLPKYARPLFLRLQSDMRVTATFKHQKADYRSEGYDPGKITDSIFALVGGKYVRIGEELFRRIEAREVSLG